MIPYHINAQFTYSILQHEIFLNDKIRCNIFDNIKVAKK